jgi:iron complex transport system ATP-binding protein
VGVAVSAAETVSGAASLAIEVQDLSVTLDGNPAVRDLSLRVAPGEWLGVIGPNGAGKTTLLRAVAGLVPFDGAVLLGRRGVAGASRRELARLVALVPQIPETPPTLTVAEYVLLGRTPHIGHLSTERQSDRIAAARAISRLALGPFVHRSLDSLSGGERQRTVLARALAQEASILLLDEPTSALDLGRGQQALELLDALRRQHELTVIAAMHDLTLAGQYADRLVLMNGGRIVADGQPQAVLTEATIGSCYGAGVRVIRENGSVFVLPKRGPAS